MSSWDLKKAILYPRLPPLSPFPLFPVQCYIFLAYIAAMAPPGYICNLVAAGHVLHNMLKVMSEGRDQCKLMKRTKGMS